MRRLVLLLALALPLPAAPKLDDLAWLAGHWSSTQDGLETEEVWLAPAGGMMLGMHRDAKGAKASFEFIRIAQTPEGIAYLAQPAGRPPTAFLLAEVTATRAVFENPKHDFPQRIVYELRDGRLCATVAGEGQPSESWCWSRR